MDEEESVVGVAIGDKTGEGEHVVGAAIRDGVRVAGTVTGDLVGPLVVDGMGVTAKKLSVGPGSIPSVSRCRPHFGFFLTDRIPGHHGANDEADDG